MKCSIRLLQQFHCAHFDDLLPGSDALGLDSLVNIAMNYLIGSSITIPLLCKIYFVGYPT